MSLPQKALLDLSGSGICITQKLGCVATTKPNLIFIHGLSMESRVWAHQFDDEELSAFDLLAIRLGS